MHGLNRYDGNREIDWGKTSDDYAKYRPGPPDSLYDELLRRDVGIARQSILDLGTGTGVVARQFAKQGCKVKGVDISEEQIEAARRLAAEQSLDVEFLVSPAESLPFSNHSFDVVTANQCWLYFDHQRVIEELHRILKPDGRLVTSHFSWLPRLDPIAAATEALVLKHNPDWSAADWNGIIPDVPDWSIGLMRVCDTFFYDELVHFTRESWHGRIRACRGVGATMTADELTAFEDAHRQLLTDTVPDEFTVLHRIDVHILS